jgi:flagellin
MVGLSKTQSGKNPMSLFSVNTNLGALAALQALNINQQAITEAQGQVSTGKKIGSAAADPAIYSISNTINANIAGLSAVSDSLNFGAQVVATASNGIAAVNSSLTQLQKTVTSSGTSGIDLTTLQSAVTATLSAINQYAGQATFNGVNLLNPTVATGNLGKASVVQGLDGSVYNIANQATAVGGGAATTLSQALGISALDVTKPGYTVSFTNALSLGSFSSLSSLPTPQASGNAAFQVTTAAGTNPVTSAQTYSFEFVDKANTAVTTLQTTANPNTHIIQVNIDTGTQSTNQITGALISAVRGQGFGVAQNTDGSLSVAGADPTTGTGISAVTFGTVTSGTGFAAVAASADGVSVASSTTAATSVLVSQVQSAITLGNKIAANLGAASQQITGIQNFTTSLSSALTAGVGALTDADLAAESARLSSLQTKQQLATQSLSIANKQPQALLTLFQGL